MMRMRVAIASIALVAAIGGTAVGQDDASPATPEGVEWRLVSVTADGATTEVPTDVAATLVLDAGGAGGSGGCNVFGGDYTLDGETLTFGPRLSTQMFCEGPAQTVEDAYQAALDTVATWAIGEDGSLQLADGSASVVLTFAAATGPTDSSLEGSWLLTSQVVGDTQADVPDGVVVSLHLADGTADGRGGCNSYSTSYTLDGQSISFGQIKATLMGCPEPAGTVEQDYFANLASVSAWAVEGGTLTLSDEAGDPLLTFEAAPVASPVGGWAASGINDGKEAVVSSATTTSVTATFAEDGTLSGSDGCNDYSTTYALDGDRISISHAITSTLRLCEGEDLAEQSQWYFTALAAATTWSVTDSGSLQLRDDTGALQVDYVPLEG